MGQNRSCAMSYAVLMWWTNEHGLLVMRSGIKQRSEHATYQSDALRDSRDLVYDGAKQVELNLPQDGNARADRDSSDGHHHLSRRSLDSHRVSGAVPVSKRVGECEYHCIDSNTSQSKRRSQRIASTKCVIAVAVHTKDSQ